MTCGTPYKPDRKYHRKCVVHVLDADGVVMRTSTTFFLKGREFPLSKEDLRILLIEECARPACGIIFCAFVEFGSFAFYWDNDWST